MLISTTFAFHVYYDESLIDQCSTVSHGRNVFYRENGEAKLHVQTIFYHKMFSAKRNVSWFQGLPLGRSAARRSHENISRKMSRLILISYSMGATWRA